MRSEEVGVGRRESTEHMGFGCRLRRLIIIVYTTLWVHRQRRKRLGALFRHGSDVSSRQVETTRSSASLGMFVEHDAPNPNRWLLRTLWFAVLRQVDMRCNATPQDAVARSAYLCVVYICTTKSTLVDVGRPCCARWEGLAGSIGFSEIDTEFSA